MLTATYGRQSPGCRCCGWAPALLGCFILPASSLHAAQSYQTTSCNAMNVSLQMPLNLQPLPNTPDKTMCSRMQLSTCSRQDTHVHFCISAFHKVP